MQRFSIFFRVIAILALVIGLFPGSFVPRDFVGSTASEKSESNNHTISDQVHNSINKLPVYFEEDRRQPNDKLRYRARGNGGATLFLTATEAVYLLQSPKSGVPDPGPADLKLGMKDKNQ